MREADVAIPDRETGGCGVRQSNLGFLRRAFAAIHSRNRRALGMVVSALVVPMAGFSAASAFAQGIHFDVAVQENASDGRMSVHGFDFDVLLSNAIAVDKRVYVRGVSISGNSLLSENPGFVSITSATALNPVDLLRVPGAQALRFNVLVPPASTMPELAGRNLSYWDGNGAVSWGPTPDPDEGIRIVRGSLANPTFSATVDGGDAPIDGFVIGTTLASGSLHEHLKYLLLPDNGALPPAGPDDGVYLMLLEVSYAPYAEWVPVFIGVEAFAGGLAAQSAATLAIESDLLLPLCSDGIDNDKDGLIDFAGGDPGCEGPDDMSERGALAECDDGIDNDGDGLIDFPNDPGCLHPTNPIEAPEPAFSALLLTGVGALAAGGRARGRRSGEAARFMGA